MFLKGYPLEAKTAPKNWNESVHISWARLASFCHLGVISDPLIVSKFHNETHDPKMTKGSLMKVESIAECSHWSTLQYFWPALSDNWSWKPILGLF